MANDETVIFNDVGPAGLRRLLVMRIGQPVEIEPWLMKVPEISRGQAVVSDFELGEKVKRFYLKLEWPTREAVTIPPPLAIELAERGGTSKPSEGRPAVMWTLEKRERISAGLLSAAELFWGTFNRWPVMGLVWALPEDAPKRLKITDGELEVLAASWVPRGCVVVC